MAKPQNLYQKLAAIGKSVEYLKHDANGYGYTYTKEDTVLANIKVGMDKYKVSLIPSIEPGTEKEEEVRIAKWKMRKTGEWYQEDAVEIKVSAQINFTWVDLENIEDKLVVPWFMIGQQSDGSQAFGAALTYAQRYFLLKFFNIATSKDDPDEFRTKQRNAQLEAERVLRADLIKELDMDVKEYLQTHENEKKTVKEFFVKYAPNGNYNSIKDSETVAKVISDFGKTFKEGEE